jgi:molecular chaperone GrpE
VFILPEELLQKFFIKNLKKGVHMTDEKISETEEVETQDVQEEPEDVLDELALKDQEIAKLKEDLEKQEAETQEYISLSQRLQADFENFKKITDKQNKEIIKFANQNIIKEFLDCYEDFGRALEVEDDKNLREGIELTYNKFKDILTKEGVEEIPAKGEKFDLNKHEALMVQASDDVENGYIIEELMKGYMYKDKVLKYSKVIVCKK